MSSYARSIFIYGLDTLDALGKDNFYNNEHSKTLDHVTAYFKE